MKVLLSFLIITFISILSVQATPTINIPIGITHEPWDQLLKKYVDDKGLVNYKSWKNNPDSIQALDDYLMQFNVKGNLSPEFKDSDYEIAALINAYNAFTIKWILENYPVKSIRKTSRPWAKKRWLIGDNKISLNEIEHDNLRPMIGWLVHSAVVCAAKSCPPLQNSAYSPTHWREQIKVAYTIWLAREDLNQFNEKENKVYLSKIFDWYGKDYRDENTIHNVLIEYAPKKAQAFLSDGKYKIKYLKYNWDLNEQASANN